ncbi:unnamed protein product [Lasius platythorax]|uniref:Uncharacterized protein n=1 Tax=Lasius platythorax TaxID=488582 RepID=A0AAV2N8X2_9HYME
MRYDGSATPQSRKVAYLMNPRADTYERVVRALRAAERRNASLRGWSAFLAPCRGNRAANHVPRYTHRRRISATSPRSPSVVVVGGNTAMHYPWQLGCYLAASVNLRVASLSNPHNEMFLASFIRGFDKNRDAKQIHSRIKNLRQC